MHKYNFFIKTVHTLALCVISIGLFAQTPTYLCELRNDSLTSSTSLEFDVYLLRTGSIPFELSTIQIGLNINSEARNGGTITVSMVSGSSQLNSWQIPNLAKFSYNESKNCIIMTATAFCGAGDGTIISNISPGTKVCRIKLTNTVNFGQVNPDLTWSWARSTGYPTKVNAYVVGLATEITVQSLHTTNNLFNPLLNGALTLHNVTSTGSFCVGGSLPIGLDGSQASGVRYQLFKNAAPISGSPYPLAGTGSAITFGNQNAGNYTIKGHRTATYMYADMIGSALLTEIPPTQGGAVMGGSTINPGQTSGLLTLSGHTGSVIKWQASIDNGGFWTDINTVNTTYTSDPLTQTTWFRAVVQSGSCAIENSIHTIVTVSTPPIIYTISRTTANMYNSIMAVSQGGNGTGLSFTYANLNSDEALSNVVSIPNSTFQYQGSTVTGFCVGANGVMCLQNTAQPNANLGINDFNNNLVTITGRNVLAPFYEDLTTGPNISTQGILDSSLRYYISSGACGTRKIIIEWYKMTLKCLIGPELYFQVVLDESDNSITFNYGNMQLYNGTQDIRWSYTCGLSGAFVSNPPLPGQLLVQQFENTTAFDYIGGIAPNIGANGLCISPEPRSSLKFSPGPYTGYASPAMTPPINDEPTEAVTLEPLATFPTNIAWNNTTNSPNLYTIRYATTSSPTICGGSNTAKDVWFKFNAIEPNVTARVFGSGGFIPRIEILDGYLNPLPTPICVLGNQGLIANAIMTGLTVGEDYYVRVYHNQTGITG